MPIEIGQVSIECDRCVRRLVHDPSPDPVSSFTHAPRWSSKDALVFAIKAGWSIEYDPKIKDFWVDCPSCASEITTVKISRIKGGAVVLRGGSQCLSI